MGKTRLLAVDGMLRGAFEVGRGLLEEDEGLGRELSAGGGMAGVEGGLEKEYSVLIGVIIFGDEEGSVGLERALDDDRLLENKANFCAAVGAVEEERGLFEAELDTMREGDGTEGLDSGREFDMDEGGTVSVEGERTRAIVGEGDLLVRVNDGELINKACGIMATLEKEEGGKEEGGRRVVAGVDTGIARAEIIEEYEAVKGDWEVTMEVGEDIIGTMVVELVTGTSIGTAD